MGMNTSILVTFLPLLNPGFEMKGRIITEKNGIILDLALQLIQF